MVKNISLHLDDEFFFKMSKDKAKKEKELCSSLTWEEYTKLIFGLQK